MLTLEVKRTPDVTVVECSGRIVRGKEVDRLIETVKAIDHRLVVLDFAAVSKIDAAGLGALAELARSAGSQRRSLQLVNPSKRVRDILEKTKLTAILPIMPAVVLQLACMTAA